MFQYRRRAAALIVVVAALTAGVSACGSGSGTPTAASASASTTGSDSGVTVSGAFGANPTVTIPDGAAPDKLTSQTLIQGSGATVGAGDVLVANYVGQTWADKKVFDSSFSRGAPAGFVIGKGQVIKGWDEALVGQKVGSRVLVTIPPSEGYGPQGNPQAGIKGADTLVFVVDIVNTYNPDSSAPGTAAGQLPAGWPKVSGAPAEKPSIDSVAGVKAPKQPESKLIVQGTGDPIDPKKTLVLQVVETDLATGKKTQASWGQAAQTAPASNVLQLASAFNGQKVGSRAVVLLPARPGTPASGASPAQPASPATVLVVDVVGQF